MPKFKYNTEFICLISALLFTNLYFFSCSQQTDSISASNDTASEKPTADAGEDFSPEKYFYVNRSSAAQLFQEDNIIYYANIFDDTKLYKYDLRTNEDVKMTDEVIKIGFISAFGGKVYFSGKHVGNSNIPYGTEYPEKTNIYSIDKDGGNLKLEIENAEGAITTDNYIYYHDSYNYQANGIRRKNIETGEVEELISSKYECGNMTMNIVGDYIYAYTSADIIKCNINNKEITNITSGKYKNGLYKAQYFEGYLYYYTYGDEASVKRLNIETGAEENVFTYNGGNFWYDVLLVSDDYIFFTGSQTTPLKEGEDKNNFLRGTFRYSFSDKSVINISSKSLGPLCYIADNALFAVLSQADPGENEIIAMDFDGTDISGKYVNLVS